MGGTCEGKPKKRCGRSKEHKATQGVSCVPGIGSDAGSRHPSEVESPEPALGSFFRSIC